MPRCVRANTSAEEGILVPYLGKDDLLTAKKVAGRPPETGTTTEGETRDEALANLREATALYLEEFPQPVKGVPMLTSFELRV
jgi:hypothetical protein